MTAPSPARRRALRAAAIATPLAVVGALVAPALLDDAHAVDEPVTLSADDAAIELSVLDTYRTGVFDASAAEIVAFHPGTDQLFVVNAAAGLVEVLDAADPTALSFAGELDPTGTVAADGSTIPEGAVANSVAVRADGLLAVALEAPVKTDDGWVAFFDAADADGAALGAVRVGALPDMVTLTPAGDRAVVAIEGEPSVDYTIDPEGGVGVIDLPTGLAAPAQTDVAIADFHAFEAPGALPEGVRVFGPTVDTDFPVSANLEPEYAAIDAGGTTAWVSLQEANAFAVVDLATATVTDVLPLGAKDHSVEGAGLDPSDRDSGIAIAPWPVLGLYMPDAVASYTADGATYLVSANEGDAREWGDYVEGARVKDLGADGLAPICADSSAADLTGDADLGRLNVTTASGLSADGTCYEQLYSFGARSISIWSADGELVADTGDLFEQVVAEAAPEFFNSNHSESNLDGRSDDKGPEPEGVVLGEIDGRTYAFVGFERVGGVAVLDVTDPTDPTFVTYLNNRDFSVSVEDADDPAAVLDQAGDLGPEGLAFIPADDSPTGEPMLAVGNEVSGTTTLFAITAVDDEPTTPPSTGPTDPTTEPTDPTTAPTEPTTPPTTAPTSGPTDAPTTAPSGSLAVTVESPVRAGGTVTARITGAAPGETLTATLRSEPVEVGTVTADADGTAVLTFVVPAETEPGTHLLVVTGPSGTAEVELVVLAADGSLPDTGADVRALVAVAGLALAGGTAILVARRLRAQG